MLVDAYILMGVISITRRVKHRLLTPRHVERRARGTVSGNTALWNARRKRVLHTHPILVPSRLHQAIGLMFRKPTDECLIFLFKRTRRDVIQMWFVYAPIDVVAIDADGMVLAMCPELAPWRSWDAGVRASAIIELPVGTLRRSGTRIGDVLVLPKNSASAVGFWQWKHYVLFFAFQASIIVVMLVLAFMLFRLAGL